MTDKVTVSAIRRARGSITGHQDMCQSAPN